MKKELDITANNLVGMNIMVMSLGEPRLYTVMDYRNLNNPNDENNPYLLVIRDSFERASLSPLYRTLDMYLIVELADVTEIVGVDHELSMEWQNYLNSEAVDCIEWADLMGIDDARAYYMAGFNNSSIDSIEEGCDLGRGSFVVQDKDIKVLFDIELEKDEPKKDVVMGMDEMDIDGGNMVDISKYDDAVYGKCLAVYGGIPIYSVDVYPFQDRN
jgi:hypothetical protein